MENRAPEPPAACCGVNPCRRDYEEGEKKKKKKAGRHRAAATAGLQVHQRRRPLAPHACSRCSTHGGCSMAPSYSLVRACRKMTLVAASRFFRLLVQNEFFGTENRAPEPTAACRGVNPRRRDCERTKGEKREIAPFCGLRRPHPQGGLSSLLGTPFLGYYKAHSV